MPVEYHQNRLQKCPELKALPFDGRIRSQCHIIAGNRAELQVDSSSDCILNALSVKVSFTHQAWVKRDPSLRNADL